MPYEGRELWIKQNLRQHLTLSIRGTGTVPIGGLCTLNTEEGKILNGEVKTVQRQCIGRKLSCGSGTALWSRIRIRIRIRAKSRIRIRMQDQDANQHQSQNSRAVEDQNGAVDAHNGGVTWRSRIRIRTRIREKSRMRIRIKVILCFFLFSSVYRYQKF